MSPEDVAGIEKYKRRTLFLKLIPQIRKIREGIPQEERERQGKASIKSWEQRTGVAQAQADLMIRKVKAILDERGVYSDTHHQYLAYAEALDKSQREMGWMVDLVREHAILRDRFERRNLKPEILNAIDQLIIYRTRNY